MLDLSWLKVISFFVVWAVAWLPIALGMSKWIGWQPNQPLEPKQKIALLLSLYLLVPIILGWKFKLERLSPIFFGLSLNSHILTNLVFGLIIALTSLIIVFVAQFYCGLIEWHRQNLGNLFPLLVPIFVLSLSIGAIEEIVFRGYIFSTLLTDQYWWLAAVCSSAIFALLHLIWERKQTIPQLPGLWLMGMVLIGARVISGGQIYLAIGLHAGWVWGLTCIDSAQIITYRHQNHWFTGIKQQPLAGIAGFSCLAIASMALWLISDRSWI